MHLTVNGDPVELETGATIQRLLEQLDMDTGRVAVEINREIIPRSEHADHRLTEGDRIEIVHAIGGG